MWCIALHYIARWRDVHLNVLNMNGVRWICMLLVVRCGAMWCSAFQQSVNGKFNAVSYLFISFTMLNMLSSMYFHFHLCDPTELLCSVSRFSHCCLHTIIQSKTIHDLDSHVLLVYYLDGHFQRLENLLQCENFAWTNGKLNSRGDHISMHIKMDWVFWASKFSGWTTTTTTIND